MPVLHEEPGDRSAAFERLVAHFHWVNHELHFRVQLLAVCSEEYNADEGAQVR